MKTTRLKCFSAAVSSELPYIFLEECVEIFKFIITKINNAVLKVYGIFLVSYGTSHINSKIMTCDFTDSI